MFAQFRMVFCLRYFLSKTIVEVKHATGSLCSIALYNQTWLSIGEMRYEHLLDLSFVPPEDGNCRGLSTNVSSVVGNFC